MLDRHSKIAVTPETHFFNQFYVSSPKDFANKEQAVRALLENPRMLDLGIGCEAILKQFDTFDCNHPGLLRATLEAYRQKRSKELVIEKTPAHLPYVPIIFDWFPNARILYIERDGRDAIMSLMRMPWSHRNLRRHARMWRWCVGRAKMFQQQYGDQWLTVRYEALVRQPDRELDHICSFLDLNREDAQLDQSIPTEVVPEWEQVWKRNAAEEKVHSGRIQEWRATGTHAQLLIMNSMMGSALRERDYPETRRPKANPLRRIINAVQNGWYLFAYHPRIRPTLASVRRTIFGDIGADQTEVVGEDVCAQWHRDNGTRTEIGA